MMKKEIESKISKFEKYFVYSIIFAVIIPNFIEPEWFVRLIAIMVVVFALFLLFASEFVKKFYFNWTPEQIIVGKKRVDNINESQRKWSRGLYYFGVYLLIPFFIYALHFPIVDLFSIATQQNYIQSAEVIISDRSESMGAWYVGQILELEQQNVSDGNLILMFSFRHALREKTYEIIYLPYSGLVLELGDPK